MLMRVFEVDEGGVKPKKASGSKWICHQLNVLKMCKDEWGLCIAHLKEMLDDKSSSPSEKAKIKGYLKKWATTKMILLVNFFHRSYNTISVVNVFPER